MLIFKHLVIRACVTLALITTVTPSLVLANRIGEREPRASPARTAFGPIGSVESLSTVTINGRLVQGDEKIWNGDRLRIPNHAVTRIVLDSIGEVVVTHGATVMLAARTTAGEHGDAGRVLIASLIEGEIVVKLQGRAGAYLEAGESTVTASFGANFSIGVSKDGVVVNGIGGLVETQQRPQRELRSTVYRLPSPPVPSPTPVKISTHKAVRVAGKVSRRELRSSSLERKMLYAGFPIGTSQSTSPEEPAPGRKVTFELEPALLGTITQPTGLTDQKGNIPAVTFVAGSSKVSGTITARIEHDPQTEIVIERPLAVAVEPAGWLRRNRNKVIIGAIAVAVAGYFVSRDPTPPLQQVRPPVIP